MAQQIAAVFCFICGRICWMHTPEW